MKSIATTIAALIAAHSFACAQTAAKLPKDAETLRKSYLEAIQRAKQPIDQKYKAELEKLLAAHTKAGHLDDAILIRAELDLLTASATSSSSTETGGSQLPSLTTGTWRWTHTTYDKETTFKEDGTFENIWFKGTWELKGRKLHLKFQNSAGKKIEAKFDANPKSMVYEGPDGLGANVILRPPSN